MAGKGIKLIGKWALARRLLHDAQGLLKPASDKALSAIASDMAGKMQKTIAGGPAPPQKASTKATGGKGKALNRGGDLAGSIGIDESLVGFFIGVNRSADGFNLAMIHEFGATSVIKITPAMQKKLHATFGGGGGSSKSGTRVIIVHIPARSFINVVIKKEEPKIPERFIRLLSKELGGLYGTP